MNEEKPIVMKVERTLEDKLNNLQFELEILFEKVDRLKDKFEEFAMELEDLHG